MQVSVAYLDLPRIADTHRAGCVAAVARPRLQRPPDQVLIHHMQCPWLLRGLGTAHNWGV